MSTQLSRRAVAKGTAWAAPAVLATATVPAYAASQAICRPEASIRGSRALVTFDFGTPADTPQTVAGSWAIVDAGITLKNLAEDETVTSLELTLAVDNRPADADPATVTSFYDPTNTSFGATAANEGSLSRNWSLVGPSPSEPRSITVNGVTHTADMWAVTFTSTGGSGTYQDSSVAECYSYTSPDLIAPGSEGFGYTYKSIPSISASTPPNGFYPNHSVTIQAKTSKGRTVTYKQLALQNGVEVHQESVLS